MHTFFNAKTSKHGLPQAYIPKDCLWDWMEYLGHQRVHAIYNIHADHVLISFPTLSPQAAQALLDNCGLSAAPMVPRHPPPPHGNRVGSAPFAGNFATSAAANF